MKEKTSIEFKDIVIRLSWLGGLPSIYASAIENVQTSGVKARADILRRLQAVESEDQDSSKKAFEQ